MSNIERGELVSNIERFENMKQVVFKVEPDFEKLAAIHGAVNFIEEASFALQILKENDYTAQVAMGNQDSLKHAIVMVASVGLSLSPFKKLAYLVPRKGKVCLDISYRGYVQLALDVGAIKYAYTEAVYEQDQFEMRGVGEEPIHTRKPFVEDRGKLVGAYCVARTHDGDFLTSIMTIKEIYNIRARSESWKAYERDNSKSNPWLTDEVEMIKKTMIRRASKSWPMVDTRRNRFDQALTLDPMDYTALPPSATEADHTARDGALADIRKKLVALGRTEEKYVEHLVRVCQRDIKKLEDLTAMEMDSASIMLDGFLDIQAKREQGAKKKDEANENAG